jgi:hypothetical protein
LQDFIKAVVHLSLVEQPAFAGRQAHNDGKLDAWPFLHKLFEHCATPTAAKKITTTSIICKEYLG